MTAIRNLALKAILVLAFALSSVAARAEYNTVKLRQVAGGYLDAVEFVTQLKQSRCGYLFQAQTDDFQQALADMAGYVTDADMAELHAYVASAEFRRVQRAHRRLINDWLDSSARYQGERGACESTIASVLRVYKNAKHDWLFAKEHYGK